MAEMPIGALRDWIGRRESRSEQIAMAPVAALAATLDRDDTPVELPPLFHWLSFLPLARLSEVGSDGHPARGGFLPPVPLPRRMWAAGRLAFRQPLRIGDQVSRVSEIADVQLRQGREGSLVFVKLIHRLTLPQGTTAITEEQDIVYRDKPSPDAPAPAPKLAPTEATWRRETIADPVLLFRYSALTFNGHRVHYDRPYATGVEGYPGLVVHGPLIATLLLDHLHRHLPGAVVSSFEFRAVRPLFDGTPFSLCGQPAPDGRSVHLWASDAGGALCTDANATLA